WETTPSPANIPRRLSSARGTSSGILPALWPTEEPHRHMSVAPRCDRPIAGQFAREQRPFLQVRAHRAVRGPGAAPTEASTHHEPVELCPADGPIEVAGPNAAARRYRRPATASSTRVWPRERSETAADPRSAASSTPDRAPTPIAAALERSRVTGQIESFQ